ncbi:hypothetical protein HWB90_gp119 [Mycobacterium phage Fowlmouth]|uniref:Uncharacterized protein n=1 Tax=Mycobacterium phage Fowlmouth TaxID=2419978 RepID=A0A3G2KGD3_9CAUD|nr:hypothetical protein HWB90_gp119 [Mycobacterium phage Fowlmouth]AYN58020.1 hypothetical protein SEA_FOWLMOUTH_71 [Mycobacterium phage Fowlmouth]
MTTENVSWDDCAKQIRKAMVDVTKAADRVRNSSLEMIDDQYEILCDLMDLVDEMQEDWIAGGQRPWQSYRDEYQERKGIYLGKSMR